MIDKRLGPSLPRRLEQLRRRLSGDKQSAAPDSSGGGRDHLGRTANRTAATFSIAISVALSILVLVLSAGFAREVLHERIWVDPIGVPDDWSKDGLTPVVVADRIVDRLTDLRRRSEGVQPLDVSARAEPVDVQLLAGGLSLRSAARWTRQLFGRGDLRFSGEIVRRSERFEMILRERSRGVIGTSSVEPTRDALDWLLRTAAEDLLAVISPAKIIELVTNEVDETGNVDKLWRLVTNLSQQPGMQDDPEYYVALELLAYYEGNLEASIAALNQASTRFPKNALLQKEVSHRYWEKGDREASRRHAQRAAELAPDQAWILRHVASTYEHLGMPERAVEYFVAANRLQPNWAWLDIDRGEYLLEWRRPNEAAAFLDHRRPKGADAVTVYLEVLGTAYARAGNEVDAQRCADELRQNFPASASLHFVEGEIALAAKDFPRAAERFAEGRNLERWNDAAHFLERIGTAMLGSRQFQAALTNFRECNRMEALVAGCHLGEGIALRELGDVNSGLQALVRAAELNPVDPVIGRETAEALRALGRRDEARVADQRAEALENKLKTPFRFE